MKITKAYCITTVHFLLVFAYSSLHKVFRPMGWQASSQLFRSTTSWRLWRNTRKQQQIHQPVQMWRETPQALLHTTRSRLFVSEHSGKEAELYCETCGELIRWKCVLKCGKHHGHDYEELDKAFERYKIEITASLHGANGEATDHHQ